MPLSSPAWIIEFLFSLGLFTCQSLHATQTQVLRHVCFKDRPLPVAFVSDLVLISKDSACFWVCLAQCCSTVNAAKHVLTQELPGTWMGNCGN
jgi:hypothetical protein